MPDRDPFADVSDKTIKAYQAYKAAIEDPHCSRADLARLTGNLESERQSDRERAAIIACKRKRLPSWLLLPPAITTLTTNPPASRPSVHGCCISPAHHASFPLWEAWSLSVSISLYALSVYIFSVSFPVI